MDDNVFASFSFTSPCLTAPRPLPNSRARNSSAAGDAVFVTKRSLPSRNSRDVLSSDISTVDAPAKNSISESAREDESETTDKASLSVMKIEDSHDLGLPQRAVGTIHVEEAKKEEILPIEPSAQDDYPKACLPSKRRLLNETCREEGSLKVSEEIEDCVPTSRKPGPHHHVEMAPKVLMRGTKGKKLNHALVKVAPPDWQRILHIIRTMRSDRNAPVDLWGPEQLVDSAADEQTQKFHVLVAAMISSQTRDAITAAAMKRLHGMPGGLTIHHIAESEVTVGALEQLLKPVGFYRQKAKHLKTISEMLVNPPYCGSVPSTLDELMKLPGVGPKVGLVVLCVGFGKGEEGLITDTNVRRVCCRLGWVPEDSTPDQTRQVLETWVPRNIWVDLSFLFVGFGQQVCKPVGPKCNACEVSSLCPSAFKCGKKPNRQKP